VFPSTHLSPTKGFNAVSSTSSVTPQDLADALSALRERPPLVQCLTNIVAAGWTANVLLAVGAAPAMVDNPREAREFAGIAGGVLVNLGTPYDDTARAMHFAITGASRSGMGGMSPAMAGRSSVSSPASASSEMSGASSAPKSSLGAGGSGGSVYSRSTIR